MITIFQTRLLHWKRQKITLLFWLLLPIIATIAVINISSAIQDESKVPVGIVLEENSPLARELIESIKQTPLFKVYETTEDDALHKIEKHELDSVFIIREGYAEQIRKGSRNRLITGYQSDLSFAYTPVSEMIISFVQQDTGRSKTAYTVRNLSEQYSPNQIWSWDEVMEKSKEFEKEENLLQTTFIFANNERTDIEREITIWKVWGLWAVFSILSTLLLFDWLIKERRPNLYPRFAFIRMSFEKYSLQNALLFTLLFFIFDLLAAGAFYIFLDEPITLILIGVLISYRFMLNSGAFLLALCFKNLYLYYSVTFAITLLIAITSGAILPIEGIINRFQWIELFNPIQPFLSREISNPWIVIFIIFISIWYVRREKSDA